MTDTKPKTRVRQRNRALDVEDTQNIAPLEGRIEVKRTRYGSEPEEVLNEAIFVPTFPVQPAYVSVKARETINMGDYNSVGVEVSLVLPCLPEASELARVHSMASDIVEGWMEHEIKRATDPNWVKPE